MNVNQLKQRSAALVFAAALVLSGCHKKVTPTPPPAPPPPPPAPTASIMATPSAVQAGQSATLSWTTTNAAQITIAGVGTVTASGTRTVTPTSSTDYTITAVSAAHQSAQATTRVTVTQPPPVAAAPSLTEEELFAQNVKDIYFDYDRYELRAGDASTAQQDATFLKSHPDMKILIEGHCDDRGSAEYNIALGQNRAAALQKALTNDGIDTGRIRVISYGSEKPFCTEDNDACWQQNRRDHLKLDR